MALLLDLIYSKALDAQHEDSFKVSSKVSHMSVELKEIIISQDQRGSIMFVPYKTSSQKNTLSFTSHYTMTLGEGSIVSTRNREDPSPLSFNHQIRGL
jgi:hypothetical protein